MSDRRWVKAVKAKEEIRENKGIIMPETMEGG